MQAHPLRRFVAIGAATVLLAGGVAAEEEEQQAEDADAGEVEEIIVSATYRDTRLMDTPLTI